jgi:ATP-binding cassette subfamily B protein
VAILFQTFTRYLLTPAVNIGLGQPEHLADRARIVDAATRTGADAFIRALPQGYDAALGTMFAGGVDLSGGQWQRLALARAVFRGAPLVILDEPTAAVDPLSEEQIFQGIRELAARHTVVLVSHRITRIRFVDRICVLDRGQLVGTGTHDELLEDCPTYADLYLTQARAEHLIPPAASQRALRI